MKTGFPMKVFQSWLGGFGRQSATCKTLIDVLMECELKALADNILSVRKVQVRISHLLSIAVYV